MSEPAAPAAAAAPGFVRIGAVGRGAGAGRSEEQLAAVGERDVAAVRARERMVARLIAVDDDFGALRQRLLGDAAAQQRVRRAALDHPLLARGVRRVLTRR